MAKMEKVKSLADLRHRAETDKRYEQLLLIASSNLGGPDADVKKAYSWLIMNAEETDELGVVGEVNYCRDLVK